MEGPKCKCYLGVGPRQISWDIFHASQTALFATTCSETEASVLDKVHDYLYYVCVRQKPEQLAGKAPVRDSVITRQSDQ